MADKKNKKSAKGKSPFDSIASVITDIRRGKMVIVHCRSGGRSTRNLPVFKKLGFKKVYHLDGGILAWEKAGYPLTRNRE
mgnify:CR=1 FL=1